MPAYNEIDCCAAFFHKFTPKHTPGLMKINDYGYNFEQCKYSEYIIISEWCPGWYRYRYHTIVVFVWRWCCWYAAESSESKWYSVEEGLRIYLHYCYAHTHTRRAILFIFLLPRLDGLYLGSVMCMKRI